MTFLFLVNIFALFLSFFVIGCVLGAFFSKSFRERLIAFLARRLRLARAPHNPILAPGAYPWSAEAVLNPAAITLGGRTHLLYRAIGMDGVSRLGYASSAGGMSFDEQLPYPAYVAQNPRNVPGALRRYSPVLYPSGGSWGGCEDPRMVAIDGRVHVTYNAFDGWDFIRVAYVSIPEEDFIAKRFYKWSAPRLISPPGQIHKNWVLFPEKINGKFAILHSIVPKIEIEYRDSLEDIGTAAPFVKSWQGPRPGAAGNGKAWDHVIRSAGPPPLKTEHGWLLFYHATRNTERHLYQLGALLLDLADPAKVIARAVAPVLSPEAAYENHGKPGIVYAAGAVIENGELRLYYGGADKVVCVATAPLDEFLDALVAGEAPELISAPSRGINHVRHTSRAA